jgi:hypothetical protein
MAALLDWIEANTVALGWLSVASAIMFVGSLVAIPWLVVQIPADYFIHRRHLVDRWQPRHPALRLSLLVAKNVCGIALILAGIAMLFLPGQGVLTIALGLMFMDFPGKFALEQRLMRQHQILDAMNWIRVKAGHPPLKIPDAPPK